MVFTSGSISNVAEADLSSLGGLSSGIRPPSCACRDGALKPRSFVERRMVVAVLADTSTGRDSLETGEKMTFLGNDPFRVYAAALLQIKKYTHLPNTTERGQSHGLP